MNDLARQLIPGVSEHPSLALANSVVGKVSDRELDELATPARATEWLLNRNLISSEVVLHEHCRGRLVAFRENLRALFEAQVTGGVPGLETIEALNRALSNAPGAMLLKFDVVSRFTRGVDHPATLVVEHVMATVGDDAASLLSGDDASKVAKCEAEGCQHYFLRTHARRQWCTTRCGDRVRAARAYARKKSKV